MDADREKTEARPGPPRIQARSRATSAGNGATGNAGAPHTGQPDGSRDSQCLHARTGIGILLRLRRNGAISPGTLCTPRHAAASSQRKGLLRRASTGSPHRFTPLSSGGGEAQQQGQATRALVVATSSVACRSRDAWLRENGFSLPFPQMGEKERSVQSSSRGKSCPLWTACSGYLRTNKTVKFWSEDSVLNTS